MGSLPEDQYVLLLDYRGQWKLFPIDVSPMASPPLFHCLISSSKSLSGSTLKTIEGLLAAEGLNRFGEQALRANPALGGTPRLTSRMVRLGMMLRLPCGSPPRLRFSLISISFNPRPRTEGDTAGALLLSFIS